MIQLIRYLLDKWAREFCCALKGHPHSVHCGRRYRDDGFDYVPMELCHCGKEYIRYPLCGGYRESAEFEKDEDTEDYKDAQEALKDYRAGKGIPISDIHKQMR